MRTLGFRGWCALVSIGVPGCSSSGMLGVDESGRLSEARAAWDRLAVATYEIDFTRGSCECLPEATTPVRVRVESDVVVSAVRRDDGTAIPPEDLTLYYTVEDVFDRIEDAIDQHAFVLAVEYDPTFGFPTSVFIDSDRDTADDEVGYEMGDLDIIATISSPGAY
jgi:Family of unknown function (DUF6174)